MQPTAQPLYTPEEEASFRGRSLRIQRWAGSVQENFPTATQQKIYKSQRKLTLSRSAPGCFAWSKLKLEVRTGGAPHVSWKFLSVTHILLSVERIFITWNFVIAKSETYPKVKKCLQISLVFLMLCKEIIQLEIITWLRKEMSKIIALNLAIQWSEVYKLFKLLHATDKFCSTFQPQLISHLFGNLFSLCVDTKL